MKFSTTTRYGLRAIVYIARKGDISSVREISTAENIPVPYLEKIILKLSKAGFISVKRGASGGYYLSRSADKISVDGIVTTLEKTTHSAPCLEEGYDCPRLKDCPTHGIWGKIDRSIHETLGKITLEDLIRR